MNIPILERAIWDNHIVIFYVLVVIAYFVFLTGKKIYYRYKENKEFNIIPKLNIRGISGISMMTAMNIALIIAISTLSNQVMGIFFKVYPGARFLIENILIKLGGILFGPVVGIFIGFTTDLFTVIFTSSVLNYGYFFSAMMNGFLGGIIHWIIKIKDPTKAKPTITSIVFAFLSLFCLGIVLYLNAENTEYSAKILSFSLSFHWAILFLLMFLVTTISTACLLTSSFALNRSHDPRYSHKKWAKWFASRYLFFLILLCNCSIYLLVDIIALPLFDVNLSSLPYEQFLISRIITSIPALILFSFLIHYIYKLHLNIKRGDTEMIEHELKPIKTKEKKEYLPTLMH